MKKLTYSAIKHNNKNIDVVFYIFGDGISTNLAANWEIYGHFRFVQINDYLASLIQFKESYENHFQPHINYNLLPSPLAYDIVSGIQKAYADNKLQFPNEKTDFIKTFGDVNEMKLIAFQTENQNLMKWFYNLNGENTDCALAGNIALSDDTLALLLKRNAHKYIQFINKKRHFSKQILDLLIKIDKYLVSELALTKNLDENALCYILPYADNDVFYDLIVSTSPPQYMIEFIACHILDKESERATERCGKYFAYQMPEREDYTCDIRLINYHQPELNFITNSLYQLSYQANY